ncbi:MAG TPA: carboxypeptidase-like regulatory domain-containing protein [Bacteroidia bacterium]|jgi:hypothetical protein|nr:carboxypeptidase-like regulatory domain-containing protein [Bacteroidia bacterium]
MKKIITYSFFLAAILFFVLLCGTQSSCTKNTTCNVDILIVDTTGFSGIQTPVAGATVKLYANINPPGQIQATGTTDNTGHFQYSFPNPAIFDIQATKGSMTGSGLIQLIVGGTATQTVLIK